MARCELCGDLYLRRDDVEADIRGGPKRECIVYRCGTYDHPFMGLVQGEKCIVRQLRAEAARLRTEYAELSAAVWACPVDELDSTHAETVAEAERLVEWYSVS